MCGIAGVVGVGDRVAARRAVRRMTAALARRGPDSEGLESWDHAVLGHRRLAIFDLSEAGRQPMMNPDRSVGVVFNGAIYNYRELRQELIARGRQFRSATDTEVLIHGYGEWGIDRLVAKLRGMFAFGLWDDRLRKLYLVRDRLGVKPLIFTVGEGFLAFASTARALKAAGYVHELDENAVIDFLKFGFVTDDRVIYRGAMKAPAASIIEWSNGTLHPREYWSLPVAEASTGLSFPEVVEQTEHLLLRSVEARLHADVPVGALLSSGIDSGLVCWAVAKLGADVTAYTVGTPGDPWDETMEARSTAKALGVRHCVVEMSAEDAPEMDELVSAYAEPFACASALGMLSVSHALAPSAKVLLTGDGGDDVFLGYPRHRHLWVADKLFHILPDALKREWRGYRSRFPRTGLFRRAASLCDYAVDGLDAYVAGYDNLAMYEESGMLGERLLESSCHRRQQPQWPSPDRHMLTDFLDYERKFNFVGEYMTKVDGATMHYGLEARSPFLDQHVWEFAASLPFDLRLRWGTLKAVLRELARRKIGRGIARRKKQGFGIPVQRWLAGRWLPKVEAALCESLLARHGWIRSDAALLQLARAVREGEAPAPLWYLFVLESWMRHEREADRHAGIVEEEEKTDFGVSSVAAN